MKKLTQKDRVIQELLKEGIVRRNWALQQYPAITRLGAIIESLEQNDGYVFEARFSKDKSDYGYILKSTPLKKVVYHIQGKEPVTTYKQ